MMSVITNWPDTDPLKWLRIGRFSKKSSRRPNTYFLMIKFKKSGQKPKILKPHKLGQKE